MSLEKAYAFLEGKKGVKVIVAIVRFWNRFTHEDLKDVAWINPKEVLQVMALMTIKMAISDDINGWNFLGPIYKEHLEYQRIIIDPSITDEETFQEAKAFYDEKLATAQANEKGYGRMLTMVTNVDNTISKHLNKTDYSKDDVVGIVTEDTALKASIEAAKQIYGFGL